MKLKAGLVLLCLAFLNPATIRASFPDLTGRWEIVHTSGDNAAQTALFPGGFSTFLSSNGTGNTFGTASNSICVIDDNTSNVVPSWISLGGTSVQITITVDNLGLGPNVQFVYTGTLNSNTPVPGDLSLQILTISGTYVATGGGASACSDATSSSPGNFVATFLPTLSSGSASGSLDGFSTDGGTPFDASVNATVNFAAPPADGQMAGTVSLATNPTFGGAACFATTSGTVNPLTINSSLSTQSGILESIYAEGLDPNGVPTTLVLNGFSANLYTTSSNTDPFADPISTTEFAVGAAIGEDDPDPLLGITGVSNDGSNAAIVLFYDVVGGACNTAGGSDAPFHFVSGKPIVHGRHKKHHHHHKGEAENREHDRNHRR